MVLFLRPGRQRYQYPEYCDRIKIGKDLRLIFQIAQCNINQAGASVTDERVHDAGLRLVEDGVSAEKFYSLFGTSMMAIFGDEITRLISRGLLSWSGKNNSTLRLTKRGILLGNQVFMAFV